MRHLGGILAFSLLSLTTHSQGDVSVPRLESITLSDVVKKVSSENFLVRQNAITVYQAKAAVDVSRGALLPALNLWKLAALAVNPASAIDRIEDIAPFLVPANWFRVEEVKLLNLAQKESYRALWANEVLTAKAIYFNAMADEWLLAHVTNHIRELETLLAVVKAQETFGGEDLGVSREIEYRISALTNDQLSLEVVLAQEKGQLSYLMGFKGRVDLRLSPVDLPHLETLTPLDYHDFEFRALDTAPERRHYDFVVRAADYVEKEVFFSFFGVSKLSRGVAGGVFNDIPMQDGLGAGTPATMRIVKGSKATLKLQKEGVEQTLIRTLDQVIKRYNLDLKHYPGTKLRVRLARKTVDELNNQVLLGKRVSALQLIEASRKYLEASTALFDVSARFLTNEDKLARLIFYGDYSKPPLTVEVLKERL